MFSLQSQSQFAYLIFATKAQSYIPHALFSNLDGDEGKKAIATTLLNYPKTDFQIGKPEL